MNYNYCQVSFFCLSELNRLISFSSRQVSQSHSSMAMFVIVHAGSCGGLQEKSVNISIFLSSCSSTAATEMKYSYYQDYSVIRSWFVYLSLGLRKASPRDSTKVRLHPR